jgi:hypothetical protein
MKATTMSEHPQILATAVAYYLEQEEARLQSLREALGSPACVSGQWGVGPD